MPARLGLVALALIAAATSAHAASNAVLELGCTSCHVDGSTRFLYESFEAFSRAPPPAPTGCAQCHVSNAAVAALRKPPGWLPLTARMLDRIRRFHAYVEAPALATTVELPDPSIAPRRLARFTACGLERFLASPPPRHGGARQSMFPLEPGRLRAVLRGLGPELARCEPPPAPASIERGRVLFEHRGCAGCHTGNGVGPRLRLGIPLLGRSYVRARIRLGAGDRGPPPIWQRSWHTERDRVVATPAGSVAMPPHRDLTDADLDALYAYITTDRSDLPASAAARPADRIDVPDAIRTALFRDVQRRVFDTSCRHCHSPGAREQTLIKQVFGDVSGSTPVELPMSRLAVSPSPTLHRILSPGPGCSDSLLLQRLKARVPEWSGHAAPGTRGMPMTLPPLDDEALRLVAVWTAAGCPSDRGDLCQSCPSPGA